jgi:hypothetical protein
MSAEVVAAIREELDDLAEDAGVDRVESAGAVEYRAGSRTIAVAEPAGLAFRLGPQVARAAAATADASSSTRGPEWVRFAPSVLDRFALDRATSWFELAVRLASPPQ